MKKEPKMLNGYYWANMLMPNNSVVDNSVRSAHFVSHLYVGQICKT
jgi:hypothetical protein